MIDVREPNHIFMNRSVFMSDNWGDVDEIVNDSFGTIDPADTMDTDPDEDPEAGGKGFGEKMAE